MITILPMDDAVKKQAVLANYPQAGGLADVIVMEEKELEYGSAVLSVEGTVLKIHDIIVCGQSLEALDMTGKFVADSLMRSAASYGEHHGAVRIEAYIPALNDFLQQKGFTVEDACAATPMSTIVHRTKPRE